MAHEHLHLMTESGDGADVALCVRHVSKTYGRRRVVSDVSLEVRKGEIHALLGQNGSGKSTLIKILAGQLSPDSPASVTEGAELTVGGVRTPLPISPRTSSDLGLVFVHQDLGLVPAATVAESLGLGSFLTTRWGQLRWRQQEARAREVLATYRIDAAPDTMVRDLTDVDRAVLAMVRGLSQLETKESGPRVLVLDEPTAFLPADATSQFFGVLKEVANRGHSIIFVSHRLDEVSEICDSASVLRDGSLVATLPVSGVDRPALVSAILGQDLAPRTRSTRTISSSNAFELHDITGSRARHVSFSGRAGEIIGITGLLGGGFEEIPYLAFGATRGSGSVTLGEATYDQRRLSPSRAIKLGMGLLPADRRRRSGVAGATAGENLVLAAMARRRSLQRVRHRAESSWARQQMEAVAASPASPAMPLSAFSGGNQQRILMMKWLTLEPDLLWLHEPTHGVDVGAKSALHDLIVRTAESGACVVIASTEYEDLAEICDRVLVFDKGRFVTELSGHHLTHPNLLRACMADVAATPTQTLKRNSTTSPSAMT